MINSYKYKPYFCLSFTWICFLFTISFWAHVLVSGKPFNMFCWFMFCIHYFFFLIFNRNGFGQNIRCAKCKKSKKIMENGKRNRNDSDWIPRIWRRKKWIVQCTWGGIGNSGSEGVFFVALRFWGTFSLLDKLNANHSQQYPIIWKSKTIYCHPFYLQLLWQHLYHILRQINLRFFASAIIS